MKKSRLKKTSKQPISLLQRKIWDECKRIIRTRYPNICYTCGATNLKMGDWQTGHMWAKASLGAFMKYDLRILRPQCAKCNRWMDGMGADFYKRMLRENGAEYMEQLERDRQVSVKAYDHYVKILEEYKNLNI